MKFTLNFPSGWNDPLSYWKAPMKKTEKKRNMPNTICCQALDDEVCIYSKYEATAEKRLS